MRRRTPIQVWPAVADLMTVLAVVGLVLALVLTAAEEEREESQENEEQVPVEELNRKSAELEEARLRFAELRRELDEVQARCRSDLAECTAEVARNELMFQAIQKVQSVIDDISENSDLTFDRDQSLSFGEGFVEFARDGTDTLWLPGGKERLASFCKNLSNALAQGDGKSIEFSLHVEGHTDDEKCTSDPHCNWVFSTARAGKFVSVMKNPDLCPGGKNWTLKPIGFSSTRASQGDGSDRRISLRLVPDYEAIMRRLHAP